MRSQVVAGEVAGDVGGAERGGRPHSIEDPLVLFEEASVPTLDRVTSLERGTSLTLGGRDAGLRMSASRADGTLAPPQLILTHSAEITRYSLSNSREITRSSSLMLTGVATSPL